MSHTPGPWRVEADGRRVLKDDGYYYEIGTVKHEEDAPIVAAAPTMLEALEAAEGVLDSVLDNGGNAGVLAVWRQVVKAIQLARKEP